MGKLIVDLFSNRFGIVLATLNVCYFAGHANTVLYHPSKAFFICANLPAAVFTGLSLESVKLLLPGVSISSQTPFTNMVFAVFITLQWLFIAWIAKTLAAKLQKSKSSTDHEIWR